MAVTAVLSNHAKFQLLYGNVNFSGDTFKGALMDNSFTFDKDTHATFANCIANEVAAGNGYTASGETLLSGELTEDDTNDRGNMSWGNITWTAAGGDIGPTAGMILFDDTSSDDTVVGYINFGQDITVLNGSSLQVQSTVVRLT
jgi:hypothetical protein